MKLIAILVFWFATNTTAFAQTIKVPDVGSVWKSNTVSKSSREDGSPPRVKHEVVEVKRMLHGLPVFSGHMYNSYGEMYEALEGTIVYANECKSNVPEKLFVPSLKPNLCVWHVCRAPKVGEEIIRKMIIFAPLYNCQPNPATYTFKSLRKEKYHGIDVTVGKAEFTFNGSKLGKWESYIEEGVGQIFGESDWDKTTYEQLHVPLVPYLSSANSGND